MIRFEYAVATDAARLMEVQVRAFESQTPPDMPELKGPPGYDSVEWQIQTMQEVPYLKIMEAEAIVGGIVLTPQSPMHCHVERIFLDPPVHSRGIGTQAFAWLEQTYPQYDCWTLRTPLFHLRNQRFYEHLGYVKTGTKEVFPGFVLIEYEKRIRDQA